MNDLVKRLRIKAGMIEMGEMIAWGSDSALMREAADALEMAAPEVQGEPVRHPATPSFLEHPSFDESANFDPVPAPDVAGLVEALEGLLPFVTSDSVECRGDKCREHWCLSCWDEETVRETVKNIRTAIAKADEALAAHRKGGEK